MTAPRGGRAALAPVAIAAAVAVAGCGRPGPSARAATLPAPCRTARTPAELDGCASWRDRWREIVEPGFVLAAPRLQAYVEGVLARVARAGRIAPVPALDLIDRSDGAGAAFLGHISLTRGLLVALDSEAELAAVLAHELAHLIGGHTFRSWSTGDGVRQPDPFGDLIPVWRLDMEAAADELAIDLLVAAGYEPTAMFGALRWAATTPIDRRRGEVDDADAPDALADLRPWLDDDHHPAPAVRAARIARVLAGRHGGEVGRARFQAAIAGTAVGVDPRRGRWLDGERGWRSVAAGIEVSLPPSMNHGGEFDGVWLWTLDRRRLAVEVTSPRGGAEVAAALLDRTPQRVAGRPAWAGIAGPAPPVGAHPSLGFELATPVERPTLGERVVVVDLGARALVVSGAPATVTAAIAGVRALGPGPGAPEDVPLRLVLVPAPAAGTIAELTARACADPEASAVLGDRGRRVRVGELIACAARGR